MIDYTPISQKPDTIPLVATDTAVLGGLDGPANQGVQALADYCAYLEDLITAQSNVLGTLGALPFAALPYPSIDTATGMITATAASATNGGTVSVAADLPIALAGEIAAGETARFATYLTPAYASGDLDVNATYYLRAKVVSGDLTLYVQKGADNDLIPGTLKGIANAETGGGFDSTVLDILLAKIVTHSAGSTPTVTPLKNAPRLQATFTFAAAAGVVARTCTLNWARTPKLIVSNAFGHQAGIGVDADYKRSITTQTRMEVVVESQGNDWDGGGDNRWSDALTLVITD